jgi:lipopolysaccharide export system protein LptA
MNTDFMSLGVNLENIAEFESALKAYKASLKESAKATVANRKQEAVIAANRAIANGSLVAGANIVVLYNKKEVEVAVKTTPTPEQANIGVTGDALANKERFVYVSKENFVRLA